MKYTFHICGKHTSQTAKLKIKASSKLPLWKFKNVPCYGKQVSYIWGKKTQKAMFKRVLALILLGVSKKERTES